MVVRNISPSATVLLARTSARRPLCARNNQDPEAASCQLALVGLAADLQTGGDLQSHSRGHMHAQAKGDGPHTLTHEGCTMDARASQPTVLMMSTESVWRTGLPGATARSER